MFTKEMLDQLSTHERAVLAEAFHSARRGMRSALGNLPETLPSSHLADQPALMSPREKITQGVTRSGEGEEPQTPRSPGLITSAACARAGPSQCDATNLEGRSPVEVDGNYFVFPEASSSHTLDYTNEEQKERDLPSDGGTLLCSTPIKVVATSRPLGDAQSVYDFPSVPGEDSPKRMVRARTPIRTSKTCDKWVLLYKMFKQNKYLDGHTKAALADHLNMEPSLITRWFSTARGRLNRFGWSWMDGYYDSSMAICPCCRTPVEGDTGATPGRGNSKVRLHRVSLPALKKPIYHFYNVD